MPMLALYGEARIAALILIVPGVGLAVYDIIRRVLESSRGERVDLTSMQYGGGTKEIAPAGDAIIGALAACWQLPFCRESLRVRCPIYHLKRRCWRERVGCMCEEATIRQSLAHFFDVAPKTGNLDFATGLEVGGAAQTESSVPTGPKSDVIRVPEIRKDQVRIPYNRTMPAQGKRERCRNCVIYNEHQRHKYQITAPIIVLAVPLLAFWKIEVLLEYLKTFLKTADRVMANLSFDPKVQNVGLASATTSSDVANFIMIGCLVVLATTVLLRWLEHVIFTLKA
ncbi:MAG: hypothetical protein FJX72_14510 [Armatimonadetes bacterium]|nr:hypothetical protein [Armatimonadota bacterium]